MQIRQYKLTLSTVLTALSFLGALVIGVPYFIGRLIYRHDHSFVTTKWIMFGYVCFFVLLVGILTPLTRWFLRYLKISNTSPLDALMTVLIFLVSVVPLFVLWKSSLPVMRSRILKNYKYRIYNYSITTTLFLLGATIRSFGRMPSIQCIVISNHTSPLDYALVSKFVGTYPWNIVAGINLRRKRPTIWDWCLAATIGKVVEEHSISVDRDNEQSRVHVVKRIMEELDNGKNIAVFPEGTRTKYADIKNKKVILQNFWDSIFRIAYDRKIPIQPLVFDWPVIWRGKSDARFGVQPCTVDVHYLELVHPANFDSYESMKKHCWDIMYAQLASSKKVKQFLG
jgi:1-acyl-sn-glycerol-3-phosphate acyltransferase